MIIYILHFICAVCYILQFPSNIFLLCMCYFMFIIPPLHRKIIYYLTEFKIPPWFILLKCIIHMALFNAYVQKINIMFLWMLIYVWNDLYYIINHAEKRLIKIDDLLYENDQRISHLYLNTYIDDVENRFHKHLFDTNRLYMFDKTDQSKKKALAVHNYRKLMKDSYPNEPIKSILIAAQGKNIFISNRYVIYIPALFIIILSGFISFELNYLSLINQIIILSELCLVILNTKHFYILSNVVFLTCVFVANQIEFVYLIQPINS